ncbi:hypothetical protein Tco_1489972 [Tanacetum coccineum]
MSHTSLNLFNASMADLEFVDQHNMVACLEKTAGNSEFHEIFWNTASSQIVNDEKQILATVDSKAVVVTKASIRSSLLLNDADVEVSDTYHPSFPKFKIYKLE